MKKFMTVLLVGVLGLFVMTACDGETTDNDQPVIGFVTYNLNDTFLNFVIAAAEEQGEEYGIEIRVADARGELLTQQDEVNALIQAGVDGLIVIPVDTSGMGPIVTAATEAEIPLVFVNRNPFTGNEDDMPDGVYFVGSQEITAGILQMELIGELLEGEGNIAIAMGTLGLENTRGRTQGVTDTIAEYFPGINVLAEESADFQRDQAITLTENWISAHGDSLNAIIANNDEMALGALLAAQQNNREDILVIGIDATPDAMASIAEGGLAGSVFQDAAGQGGGGVSVLNEIFGGGSPESVRWVPFQLITLDNIEDFQ